MKVLHIVHTVIAEESATARRRILLRAQPLLQKEFDRLHVKYPFLRRVVFGTSSFVIDSDRELPADAQDFADMCNVLAPYGPEDLAPIPVMKNKERPKIARQGGGR